MTHSSFLDLFLLAECDYFVGTLSRFARIKNADLTVNRPPAATTLKLTASLLSLSAVPSAQ